MTDRSATMAATPTAMQTKKNNRRFHDARVSRTAILTTNIMTIAPGPTLREPQGRPERSRATTGSARASPLFARPETRAPHARSELVVLRPAPDDPERRRAVEERACLRRPGRREVRAGHRSWPPAPRRA